MSNVSELIDATSAARILEITPEYLRKLAVAGKINATMTPYGRLYEPRDVEALKAARAERKRKSTT